MGCDKMKPLGLKIIKNEAFLHNYKISDLANKYQTPLYIMDEEQINRSIQDYLTFFKSDAFHTSVVYASKAFLTTAFVKYIDSHGLFIDAVSLGDLYVIHKAGFTMEKVVFHGNNKSIAELQYAIETNVGIIVVDNLFELEHLSRLANDYQKKISILIRINPGIDAHTHQYIQTAKFTSKFGESMYDEEMIYKLIKVCQSSKYIKLLGFHAHIGSQIHETEAFKLEVSKMIDFQNRVNDKFQLSLDTLNLGGGFGIQYTYDEKSLSIQEMMTSLITNIEKKLKSSNSKIRNFMIEPGRSIVGEAGITVYTCSQIKSTYGKKNYLFIDGGMTDNIRPALYGAVYECDVATKMNNRKEILVDVVGKCCESGDIIRKDVLVPRIDEGDILIVYATGAYNYSMSSNYNNLLKPAVIMVGKEVKVMSRREQLEDLCKLF
jgi:diaminopimelate decarboxylase